MQPHPGNFYIQMSIDNNSVMHELPIGIFGFVPQIDTERVWEVTITTQTMHELSAGTSRLSPQKRRFPAAPDRDCGGK